jgi:hypothetical protein
VRKGKFIAAICVAVVAAVWGAAYASRPPWKDQIPADVQQLFARHGWTILGDVGDHRLNIPPGLGHAPSLAAPPWLWELGLSKAVGLDFSAYAGQNVKVLGFRVRDAGGQRLTQYHLVADVIIHPDAGTVGAWLCAPEETPGEIKPGEFRCYDLDGASARR